MTSYKKEGLGPLSMLLEQPPPSEVRNKSNIELAGWARAGTGKRGDEGGG